MGKPKALLEESEGNLLFEDPEIGDALYEQARDADAALAQPVPSGALSAPEPELLPTPEMELAFIEEAMLAEEPPEPIEEPPIPALGETAEEQPWTGGSAAVASPPPETSDVIRGVLPPRPRRMAVGRIEATSRSPGLGIAIESYQPGDLLAQEWVSREGTESLAPFGEQRVHELNQRIDSVYDRVLVEAGTNKSISTWCFEELRTARDLILRYDVAALPEAEYHVQQVVARLKRAEASRAAVIKYALWIVGWGLLWAVLLLAALTLLDLGWFDGYLALAGADQAALKLEILLPAMVWGGIGGVVAVWYSLFKHASRRDFDPQYNLSYVGKPFFGLVLGAMVYMLAQLLNLIVGIWPALLLEGVSRPAVPVIAPWVIYVLAWVCGFYEHRLFELMDCVVKRVFSDGETATVQIRGPAK
jgi:hypothetical protein